VEGAPRTEQAERLDAALPTVHPTSSILHHVHPPPFQQLEISRHRQNSTHSPFLRESRDSQDHGHPLLLNRVQRPSHHLIPPAHPIQKSQSPKIGQHMILPTCTCRSLADESMRAAVRVAVRGQVNGGKGPSWWLLASGPVSPILGIRHTAFTHCTGRLTACASKADGPSSSGVEEPKGERCSWTEWHHCKSPSTPSPLHLLWSLHYPIILSKPQRASHPSILRKKEKGRVPANPFPSLPQPSHGGIPKHQTLKIHITTSPSPATTPITAVIARKFQSHHDRSPASPPPPFHTAPQNVSITIPSMPPPLFSHRDGG